MGSIRATVVLASTVIITLKNFDFKNVRSESFSIRTSEGRATASELVLRKGGPKNLTKRHKVDQLTYKT